METGLSIFNGQTDRTAKPLISAFVKAWLKNILLLLTYQNFQPHQNPG
jgi:hypothetical protein